MEEKIWGFMTKRFTGTETQDSSLLLDQWLAADATNRQKYNEAKAIWELTGQLLPEPPVISFDEFRKQADLERQSPAQKNSRINKMAFWKYGIAAALSGIFILAGLYYYAFDPAQSSTEPWIVKKAGAGKMIKIHLPDGSVVWLNSGSEISFAQKFNDQALRNVRLKGEAYFEVKHDKKHPFVVKSGKLSTTVYGTSFSVRAYGNEGQTTVAVNSGKVGVTGEDGQHRNTTVMLLPSDKLSYNAANGKFIKTTMVNKDVNAWISGELVFEQTPLSEVFETLSRKYKLTINADASAYAACKLTARFSNAPIEAVLKAIRLSLNIQSKQIGQTIYLKGGNCM